MPGSVFSQNRFTCDVERGFSFILIVLIQRKLTSCHEIYVLLILSVFLSLQDLFRK